jgi:SAM-dependent methyltransferase
MADAGSQEGVNRRVWERGSYVGDYANRRLLPVEVLLLVRYRDALSKRPLEVGCGAGRVLGYLAELGGEAHGIDISEAMVAHCRAAYPSAHVRVGDLGNVPASVAGTFSAILAMDNVLDIYDDAERRRVLGDLRDLLDPGGVLIFSSHNLDQYGTNSGPQRGSRIQELAWKAGSRPIGDVVRVGVHMPQRIRNRRRLAPLERREADYAIINDPAHDYGLLHYYVGRDAQARQLTETGLALDACLDVEGHPVGPGERSAAPWLHYIARVS